MLRQKDQIKMDMYNKGEVFFILNATEFNKKGESSVLERDFTYYLMDIFYCFI